MSELKTDPSIQVKSHVTAQERSSGAVIPASHFRAWQARGPGQVEGGQTDPHPSWEDPDSTL